MDILYVCVAGLSLLFIAVSVGTQQYRKLAFIVALLVLCMGFLVLALHF